MAGTSGRSGRFHVRIYTGSLARLPLCHAASKRDLPLTLPNEADCGNCARSRWLRLAALRSGASGEGKA